MVSEHIDIAKGEIVIDVKDGDEFNLEMMAWDLRSAAKELRCAVSELRALLGELPELGATRVELLCEQLGRLLNRVGC